MSRSLLPPCHPPATTCHEREPAPAFPAFHHQEGGLNIFLPPFHQRPVWSPAFITVGHHATREEWTGHAGDRSLSRVTSASSPSIIGHCLGPTGMGPRPGGRGRPPLRRLPSLLRGQLPPFTPPPRRSQANNLPPTKKWGSLPMYRQKCNTNSIVGEKLFLPPAFPRNMDRDQAH